MQGTPDFVPEADVDEQICSPSPRSDLPPLVMVEIRRRTTLRQAADQPRVLTTFLRLWLRLASGQRTRLFGRFRWFC